MLTILSYACQTMVRLIKRDLKTSAGEKHVLDALGPNAHSSFLVCRVWWFILLM